MTNERGTNPTVFERITSHIKSEMKTDRIDREVIGQYLIYLIFGLKDFDKCSPQEFYDIYLSKITKRRVAMLSGKYLQLFKYLETNGNIPNDLTWEDLKESE